MNKFIVIFVVLTVTQSFLSEARTIDNVLEDFQPVFNEIHDRVSNAQSYAHTEGNKRITNMRSFISQHSWDNINALQTSVNDIRNQMTSILTETGMIHHEDLIRHCFTKEQSDSAYYNKEAHATTEVCQILASKDVKYIDEILVEFYQKQANFHSEIESTKAKCNNSKTTFEMQTCLIENLYLIYKPAAKSLEQQMFQVLQNIDKQIVVFNSNLNDCYVAVGERIVSKKIPIIADFKRCIVEAAINKP